MKYVIIGNGAAGLAAAEKLTRLDPNGSITMLTAEVHPVYSKCLLPDYLSGDLAEERLFIRERQFYEKHKINLHRSQKVVRIDFEKKCVMTKRTDIGNKEVDVLPYDRLLIATGSKMAVPPITGLESIPFYTLGTLDDAKRIMDAAKNARKITIVGGGFVGLEIAFSLYKQGREITVIEKADSVLPAQLDETAAHMLQDALEEEGIRLFTQVGVAEVRHGGLPGFLRIFSPGKEHRVILSDGRTLKSDMVIVATGSHPCLDFLSGTRIRMHRGIAVDTRMQTSVPDVFAAGDVVETVDAISGSTMLSPIWPNAVIQGEVTASNMAGVPRELGELISMQNASEFREIPMISMGLVDPHGAEYEILYDHRPVEGIYRKLVLKDDIVVGMIFLGDLRSSGVIGALIKDRTNVGKIKRNMLNPNFGYSEVAALR